MRGECIEDNLSVLGKLAGDIAVLVYVIYLGAGHARLCQNLLVTDQAWMCPWFIKKTIQSHGELVEDTLSITE